MKYAIIKTGGKQYKIKEGEEIVIDQLKGKEGEKVNFNEVFLAVDGQRVKIGMPKLEKVEVVGEIVKQIKGEKIRVAKFRAKSRYRRVKGFRPLLTCVRIQKIKVVD